MVRPRSRLSLGYLVAVLASLALVRMGLLRVPAAWVRSPIFVVLSAVLLWVALARNARALRAANARLSQLVRARTAELRAQVVEREAEEQRVRERFAELEQRFAQRSAELESLLRHAPIGFAFFDRQCRYLRLNAELALINGLPVEAHLGRTPGEILPGIAHVERDIRRVFETGEPVRDLDVPGETPAQPGEHRTWLASYYPVRGPDGSVDFVGCVVTEITERKRREQAHARNALQYQALSEHNRLGVIAWNAAGELTEVNDAFLDIIGYTRDDLRAAGGKLSWRALTPPEHEAVDDNALRELATTGICAPFEKEYLRRDGSRAPVLVGVGLFKETDPGSGVAWVVDLAPLKKAEARVQEAHRAARQAEQARRESEACYRLLADMVPDILFSDDASGYSEWVNRRWYEYTGMSPGTAIGRQWLEALHPDDAAATLARYQRAVRTGEPFDVEYRLRGRDGTYRWFMSRARPFRDSSGKIIRWYGACADIENQKRVEQALLEEQLLLVQTITDNATSALFLLDERGHCTFMNPAAQAITGYSLDDLAATSLHDVLHQDDAGRPCADPGCVLFEALCTPRRLSWHELPLVRKDGRRFPALCAASPIHKEGRPASTVLEIRDHTEQRQLAEARERLLDSERAARAEMARVSRLKDEFVATVSHELRTPLTAILGWTQLLQRPGTTREQMARGLRIVERNARVQTQLISDLLDASRAVAGKLHLDVNPLALPSVIDAAIDSMRAEADAKRIEITKCIDPIELPLLGDPGRMQQVVWNLLSNAIKFTPPGGRVDVSASQVGACVELAVSDTGQGIEPHFLPHVFERFRQADSSAARRHGGLGLGLSIVKHIVELHGGRVRAESEGIGKGARFVVELPSASMDVEGAPEPALGDESVSGPLCTVALRGVSILLVEDELDAQEYLRRLLEEAGARVVTAASAEEALQMLAERLPDVLVSDIGMPGMDGYDLLRELRAGRIPGGARLPAVAVTAFARAEDRAHALGAGYQSHVAKPVDPAQLLLAVARLVGAHVHEGRVAAG